MSKNSPTPQAPATSAPASNPPVATASPKDTEGFDFLKEMALDLRSCWNHAADKVWRMLDPDLWTATKNPWAVLNATSRAQISRLLAKPAFRKDLDSLAKMRHQRMSAPAWFQQEHAKTALTRVAYFSMEFMLSESLPIYSGGLGNVAGDQLKAAGDLGVPVVGIGLLYQQGYFRQTIDKDGGQQALYPENDPEQLPISPLRLPDGSLLRLEIALPGNSVWLRAWKAQVGRTMLYLLDSNDPANNSADRGITSQLYGGGPELRLKQEILLGIGGWRLLEALDIHPEVCHLNEGHAAFAVLERAQSFMKETSTPFDMALTATRAGNLFTTHTAVAAGFDRFPPALIEHSLGSYAKERLGISLHDLLALGRQNPDDNSEPFNMAYLAVRGSGAVNGVSRLHGQVSRHLFEPLFPRWPEDEVPIGHITNGVHMPTWDSAHADDLWTDACGKDRWQGTATNLEQKIRGVPDATIWALRATVRKTLVEYARGRLSKQLSASGASPDEVEAAKHLFNPDALTLGFARRFATYKRPDLLLHDRDRLLRILSRADRPVQLIIAGKAHPEDRTGQDLIREWISFIRRPDVRPHIIFLSDYDMLMAEQLVQGVDVWINTPRRPWEASGTSGMKVLVNGGLNLSELDGWWAEAYTPEAGWALGDGKEHGDDPNIDAQEANQFYELLEREVVPEFYTRGTNGVPVAWIKRIRESMAQLTPRFSAERAVREYTEKHYIPAAAAVTRRAASDAALGRGITERDHTLAKAWPSLRFGEVKVQTGGDKHHFEVQVLLNDLDLKIVPTMLKVELYANGVNGSPAAHQEMTNGSPAVTNSGDGGGGLVYTADVPATRPSTDYTARVVQRSSSTSPGELSIPLEGDRVLWQR